MMQLTRNWRKCFGRTLKTVLTAVLAFQLLTLLALAACPLLHHALHPDSDQPGHECLVTAFAKGHAGEALMPQSPAWFAVFSMGGLLLAVRRSQPQFEYRFAPGRGPPRR